MCGEIVVKFETILYAVAFLLLALFCLPKSENDDAVAEPTTQTDEIVTPSDAESDDEIVAANERSRKEPASE